MRKLIYSMMVSVDGFVEGPNRELDWHIIDEELHTFINDQQRDVDTHLCGRRLYEVMSYWDTADQNPSAPAYELEFARIWKTMSKVVFSKTLDQVGPNAHLVRDNLAEEIIRLKQQPGKDMEIGGPNIAATALRLGPIDEYRLFIQPVVIGKGTPYFPALDDPLKLRLVETHTFGSGVVYLRYQRADQER